MNNRNTNAGRYGLTPMQQGMLLENLYAPESGVNIEQIVCKLPEKLDLKCLREAWRQAAGQHDVLRTSFHALERGEPYQVVHDRIEVPFEVTDWRGYSPAERHNHLSQFLDSDRRRGFHWESAPLMRLSLFQCGDRDNVLVWTFHHALLDGRSFVIVIQEVFGIYESLCSGVEVQLTAVRPFRDHVEWLRTVDHGRAESYWRELLSGFTPPTPLAIRNSGEQANAGRGVETIRISEADTAKLRAAAAGEQVTLNTFLQAAWALLLSRYSQETDIVFGAVRACRKSGLPGADRMVGLFINTLPMRVRISEEQSVSELLQSLRAQQMALRAVEHTPLSMVQRWVEAAHGASLFQSILVFENFRLENYLRRLGERWSRRGFQLHEKPGFPLTLYAYAEKELFLELAYERELFDRNAVARALEHLQTLMIGMAERVDSAVGAAPILSEPERNRLLGEWNATQVQAPLHKCIHHVFEEQVGTQSRTVHGAIGRF